MILVVSAEAAVVALAGAAGSAGCQRGRLSTAALLPALGSWRGHGSAPPWSFLARMCWSWFRETKADTASNGNALMRQRPGLPLRQPCPSVVVCKAV